MRLQILYNSRIRVGRILTIAIRHRYRPGISRCKVKHPHHVRLVFRHMFRTMIQHLGYRAYLLAHTSFAIFRIGIILHPQRRFIIRCRALPYDTARRLCIPVQPTAPALEKTACYRFAGILVTAQQQDLSPHIPYRQVPPERNKIVLQILTRQ